jgi:hypothetical protein
MNSTNIDGKGCAGNTPYAYFMGVIGFTYDVCDVYEFSF